MNFPVLIAHLRAAEGPMAKTAAAKYFHSNVKEARDQEALGKPFCKLAAGFSQDPWDLAEQVAPTIEAMRVLAKTASGQQQELAQFYVDWADGMTKGAGVASVMGKLLGRGGAQRAASSVTGAARGAALSTAAAPAAAQRSKAVVSKLKPKMEAMEAARRTPKGNVRKVVPRPIPEPGQATRKAMGVAATQQGLAAQNRVAAIQQQGAKKVQGARPQKPVVEKPPIPQRKPAVEGGAITPSSGGLPTGRPTWQKALGAAGVTGMVGLPAYYGAKSALTPQY